MSAKRQPTLSLCMIVKDEERFLAQCLESVKDVVDEMIIVDTGSRDRTVEIAESYGAKILHHPWQGSFSEARNYGLGFATGDWVFQMDADEALEREDIPLIQEAIRSDAYNAIFVALLNASPEGWSKHYFQRIFRRGKAHYEGIVHNQLVYEGAHLQTEIKVYHYGYNLSKDRMKAKYKRSEALLRKQIEEDPTHAFAHQNYVRVLRASERYGEASEAGLKALECCRDTMTDVHRQMIAYDTAYCLMLVGRVEEAETLCREVLEDHPENLNLLFTLPSILVARRKYGEAIAGFERFIQAREAFEKQPKHTLLIIDTNNFGHKAWGNISDCYFELGEYERAEEAARRAVEDRPDLAIYGYILARALVALGRNREAERVLNDSHTKTTEPRFFLKWAALCQRYPFLGDPVEKVRMGLDKHPDSDELFNYWAWAIHQTETATAKEKWQRVLEINPEHVGASVGMARVMAREGDVQGVVKHADLVLQTAVGNDVLKEMGGYCIQVQEYPKAVELFSRYLAQTPEDVHVLSDIATCYAKMGQYEAAWLGYREALRLNPHNPQIVKNLRTLACLLGQSADAS